VERTPKFALLKSYQFSLLAKKNLVITACLELLDINQHQQKRSFLMAVLLQMKPKYKSGTFNKVASFQEATIFLIFC